MKKDNRLYLDHILSSFRKVVSYVDEILYEDFVIDEEKQDAVIPKIEVAGEATKRLSQDFKDSNRNIPWRAISGMRDKLKAPSKNIPEEARIKLIELDLLFEGYCKFLDSPSQNKPDDSLERFMHLYLEQQFIEEDIILEMKCAQNYILIFSQNQGFLVTTKWIN